MATLTSVDKKNIKLNIESGTDRTLYAEWTYTNTGNLAKEFMVVWYYRTDDKVWFQEDPQTVNLPVSDNTTRCKYTPPENAVQVRFRVKPVPKNEGDKSNYTGLITYQFTSVKKIIPAKDIGIKWATNGSDLLATWDYEKNDGMTDHFLVRWYHYLSTLKTWEVDGDDEEVRYEFRYHRHTPDLNFNLHGFKIMPVAEYDVDYIGEWSELIKFNISGEIEDRRIDDEDITIGIVSGSERTVYATWNYSTQDGKTSGFDVLWDYSMGNGWVEGTSERVDQAYRTSYFTPEEGALKVRFKITPVPAHIYDFEPKESPEKRLNLTADKGATAQIKADKLSIIVEGGTERNMVGKWTTGDKKTDYSVEDGRTSGFECLWEYYTGDGIWYTGSTETLEADAIYSTYNAPANATQVRFAVKPVPTSPAYFVGKYSAKVKYIFKAITGSKAKIGGVKVGLQTGTDRTLFASWAESANIATVKETDASTMILEPSGYATQISNVKHDIIKLQPTNQYMALAPVRQPNIFVIGDRLEYSLFIRAVGTNRTVSLRIYAYDSDGHAIGSNFASIAVTAASKNYTGSIEIKDLSNFKGSWNNAATYSLVIRDVNDPTEQLGIKEVSVKRVPQYSITDKHTDHFEVRWQYTTGDGVWFTGSESTVEANKTNCTYSAPSNAKIVRFAIRPISKTYTANGMESTYFVGIWSANVKYSFVDEVTVETPSVPEVTINGNVLTAEVDCYDPNANYIEFQVARDDSVTQMSGIGKVVTNHVSFVGDIYLGHNYKVRCRAYNTNDVVTSENVTTIKTYNAISEWSEYSNNVSTIPGNVSIVGANLRSGSEIQILFGEHKDKNGVYDNLNTTAESYEIEYTRDPTYFDHSSSEVKSNTFEAIPGTSPYVIISGLDTGIQWFFRMRGTNSQGNSAWSNTIHRILGTRPSAPTTWSEAMSVPTSGVIVLYWVHNSEDGSDQTSAELKLTVGKNTKTVNLTTENTYSISVQGIDSQDNVLSPLKIGGELTWEVRTYGISSLVSPWSSTRKVNVIAAPSISNFRLNTNDQNTTAEIQSFPLVFTANVLPTTQTISGYRVVIKKVTAMYEGESSENKKIAKVADITGNLRQINIGQAVYDKYISYPSNENEVNNYIRLEVGAADFFPENGVEYSYSLTVYMRSGLSTTVGGSGFVLATNERAFDVNADVSVIVDKAAATIRPYCYLSGTETLATRAVLYVYRREFDGSLTLVQGNYENIDPNIDRTAYIVDPHPGLDYARYRIVAQNTSTGQIDFVDLPGAPVGIKSIVIKWNEEWQNYETDSEDALDQLPIQGSMIMLPYNVDISDSYAKDAALVEYIGRSNPVSYYGTQVGESAEWSVAIPATSVDLLYQLRKLAVYQGDVFVREPSGSGYWANITVSFSKNHSETTIPVKLSVKRVEGGK